jgi:hypothetical protein
MDKATIESEIEAKLQPETELELRIINEPDFQKGLFWGKPRYGHPEGQIINHIPEVLANVEKLPINAEMREKLRLITFVHDTFKYIEDKGTPRDWSKHHGVYARKFLAQFVNDQTLLNIVELHDEAYYSWRLTVLYKHPDQGMQRLQNLLEKVGKDLQLFYLFFKCDTQTGDKIQTPVRWFEETVENIDIIHF